MCNIIICEKSTYNMPLLWQAKGKSSSSDNENDATNYTTGKTICPIRRAGFPPRQQKKNRNKKGDTVCARSNPESPFLLYRDPKGHACLHFPINRCKSEA